MLLWVSLMWLLVVSLVCLLVISTWSPPKSLAWQKGFRLGSGLTLRKLGLLLLGCSLLLLVSVVGLQAGGHRRDFVVGCPLAAAAVLSCKVQPDRWIAPHLAIRALFDCVGGSLGLRSLFSAPPFGLLLGCLLLIRVVVPSLLRFREFGRYMMSDFNLCLVGMPLCLMSPLVEMMFLLLGLVWSRAAESALADAFRFSGGPLPSKGFGSWQEVVLCFVLFSLVVLGFAELVLMLLMLLMLLMSFLYCDSSVAPLLDMRRRFKAVMDVLGAMIRHGVSLSRSVELTAQWDKDSCSGADVSCYFG